MFFKRHRFQRIGRVDRHHQAFRTFPAQVQHQASAGGIGDGDTVISPLFHQGPGSAAGRNEIFLQHGKVFPLFRTGNPPAPCLRTGKGRNLARPIFIQEERGRTDLEKTLQLRRAEKTPLSGGGFHLILSGKGLQVRLMNPQESFLTHRLAARQPHHGQQGKKRQDKRPQGQPLSPPRINGGQPRHTARANPEPPGTGKESQGIRQHGKSMRKIIPHRCSRISGT